MPKTSLRRTDNWYGIERVTPTFTVATESFAFEGLGGFHRTTSISGHVWDVVGRRRADLINLPDIRPDGSLEVQNPNYSIAGHLIAVALTGTDDPENLTPVSKMTNDAQRVVENKIRKFGPCHMSVTVTGYYADDPRIPTGFHYVVHDLAGKKLLDETVNQPVMNVGPMGASPQLAKILAQATAAVKFLGWTIESVTNSEVGHRNLTFLAGTLPPPQHRPYAGLDYLLLTRLHNDFCDERATLDYVNSIAARADFGREAKSLALRANPLRHNDFLCSDAYNQPHTTMNATHGAVVETESNLINGGGFNAPQVDHILPQAAGGSNCLSNAQITSMRYNAGKQDTTRVLVPHDKAWHDRNLAAMRNDPKLKPFL